MREDFVIDRDGRRRALRPGEVIRDGERMVVPLLAMDNAPTALRDAWGNAPGHKPGFVFSHLDASPERLAARGEYEERITSAWRGTVVSREAPTKDDAYAARDEWLRTAWRGAR